MSFNFVQENFHIGQTSPDLSPQFIFYKRGFRLGGSSGSDWQDIILSGNGSLTLTNAKSNGLNYLKLFGGCEQNGTPTPTVPVDIVCNNGALKLDYTSKNLNVGTLDNQGYNSTGGTSSSTIFCGTLWKIKVSEGEKYTVSYGSFPDGISGVFINTWKTDGTWNLRQAISISSAYTYTIPVGIGAVNFTLYKTGGITIGSNSWVQVEKGDTATAYVPAGYGLQTKGTTETVEIYGNNMFNKNDTANIGNWYSSSNKISMANANATLVMRAIPNATYYYKHCSVTGGGRAFYTEVEDWRIGSDCSEMAGSTTINKDEVKRITVSANAKWVFFNYGSSALTATFEEQLADYMVSLTPITASTPYENYFNGGTATAEMLLKVGDYKDVQEVLTGEVTRNVAIKVFDGTETWSKISNQNAYYLVIDEMLYCNPVEAGLSNQFVGAGVGTANMPDNSVKLTYTAGPNRGAILFKHNDTTTLEDWVQFVTDQYNSGNPIIAIYPLATATTETVTGQTLTTKSGSNTITITQASIDNLGLEVSYKAGVRVTITEVQNAQLDNSVEVTVNG